MLLIQHIRNRSNTNTQIRIVKRGTQLYSFLWTLLALLFSPSPFLCVSLFTWKHFLPETPRGHIWRTETQLSFSFQSSITTLSGLAPTLWQPACSCPSYFNSILWRFQLLVQTQGPPALSSPSLQTYSLSYCSLCLLHTTNSPGSCFLMWTGSSSSVFKNKDFILLREKDSADETHFQKCQIPNASCSSFGGQHWCIGYTIIAANLDRKKDKQPRGELQRNLQDGRTDKPRRRRPH